MNAIEEKRRYQETNVELGYSDNLLDIFEYIRVVNFQIKFKALILEWLG